MVLYERTGKPEKANVVRAELGPETLLMPRAVRKPESR
jgi:hypothetical protein